MALAPGSLCTHAQPLLSSRTNVSFVVEHYFFFFLMNFIYYLFGFWLCWVFSAA